MADRSDQQGDARGMLMTGNSIGLALIPAQDMPIITRWNQDFDFTARIGTPGEAHTIEMRQAFFEQNARIKPDSAEFSITELSTGRPFKQTEPPL